MLPMGLLALIGYKTDKICPELICLKIFSKYIRRKETEHFR